MLEKIYLELIAIRRELQIIRNGLEFLDKKISIDREAILQAVQRATHDIDARYQE